MVRIKEEQELREREERQSKQEALALSRQKFVEKKKDILSKKTAEVKRLSNFRLQLVHGRHITHFQVIEKKPSRSAGGARKRKAAAAQEEDFLNDSSDLGEYLEKERNREPGTKRAPGAESRRIRRSRRERQFDDEREGSSDGEGVHVKAKTAEEAELDAIPQRMRKKGKDRFGTECLKLFMFHRTQMVGKYWARLGVIRYSIDYPNTPATSS